MRCLVLAVALGGAASARAAPQPLAAAAPPATALPAGAPAFSGGCPALPRAAYPYPIVLKGPPMLAGQRVERFEAWARQGGKFRPVPVQVEEINSSGDYVLEGGIPYTKDSGTGMFNSRDELVFDGADLGDDFRLEDVAPEVLAPSQARWKLGICVQGKAAGWLLILNLRGRSTHTFPPAVTFDKDAQLIRSSLYSYQFDKKNPVLLGEVKLAQAGGPVPVIAASKFLMPLKTPFYLPDMTFADEDFTSTIESWQRGPLRTIVAVGVKYTSFLSLFKLHLFSELVFYRNRFVIPTVIQFVFDPSDYLRAGSGIAYALHFPTRDAWKVESNLAPLPHLPPDEAIEKAKKATDTDVFYARATGKEGSFLVQVRVDPKARRGIPSPFLLSPADLQAGDPANWPWLKDLGGGDLGVFLDFSRIHQGTYNFGLDLLVSPKANETFTDYGSVDPNWRRLYPSR